MEDIEVNRQKYLPCGAHVLRTEEENETLSKVFISVLNSKGKMLWGVGSGVPSEGGGEVCFCFFLPGLYGYSRVGGERADLAQKPQGRGSTGGQASEYWSARNVEVWPEQLVLRGSFIYTKRLCWSSRLLFKLTAPLE